MCEWRRYTIHYTRGGQHVDRDQPFDRRVYRLVESAWFCIELTRYLKRTFFSKYFRKQIKMKKVAFHDFLHLWLYYRLADRKLSRNIKSSPDEDKLATNSSYNCSRIVTVVGVIPNPFDIAAKWQNTLTGEMSRYRLYTNPLSTSFDVAALCI